MKWLLATACLAAAPAHAQTYCIPTASMHDELRNQHNEQRVMTGVERTGNVVELWAHLDTGKWTLIYTRVDGTSCALSSGGDLQVFGPAPNL